MSCSDSLSDANNSEGRFIYSPKDYGTGTEMGKVLHVVQGFIERDRPAMGHNANALRASSTRLVLSVTASLNVPMFSHDATQAYQKRKYKMKRDVFINPRIRIKSYFDLGVGNVLKLEMPLYNL